MHFTMPDKFEDGWKMEFRTAFDRYVSGDYIPPNCGPTINKPDNNFTYLGHFQLFVMDDIIAEICRLTASNAMYKGKPDFQAPTVEELKAYFGLYIVANDFVVTPSDCRYLCRTKATGYSIHQNFQMYLPASAMKKSNTTCIFVTCMLKYQTDLVLTMTL